MKRQIERVKAVRPSEGLKHVDPDRWREPTQGRDWVEYVLIAAALVALAWAVA